jgi:hypothetical protein
MTEGKNSKQYVFIILSFGFRYCLVFRASDLGCNSCLHYEELLGRYI